MLPLGSDTPTAPFTPSPEVVSQLLEDLVDPDTSLRALARRYETTLDVLTGFLAREDIAERVDQIEQNYARKARLVATAHLPAVAHMLTRLIDEHQDEANHIPVNPKSLPALEQRRRSRETARRAATLLLRIAKFQAGLERVRAPRHAEDEAPPRPLHPSSATTPNPRVSPSSPASLPIFPSGPLSPWERPCEGSCLDFPSASVPSALTSPSSPSPTPIPQMDGSRTSPVQSHHQAAPAPAPPVPALSDSS